MRKLVTLTFFSKVEINLIIVGSIGDLFVFSNAVLVLVYFLVQVLESFAT